MLEIHHVAASPVACTHTGIAEALQALELPASRLREAELIEVVLAVSRLQLWHELVRYDPDDRWWMPLYTAHNFEVTLQTWDRAEASDWHDHGGSSGAFAVTAGGLLERYRATDGATVLERRITMGKVAAFGPGHVHDVAQCTGEPATSLHAYSPPLTRLTYYDRTSLGFVAKEIGSDVHGQPPSPSAS